MVFYHQNKLIDGSGYAIAVLDTGIDLDHPFFGPDLNNDNVADRIVHHYDFAATSLQNFSDPTSNDDSSADDPNDHGSHVAGIAASEDSTYQGIAPGADIIALKVFDDDNQGNLYDLEQALQWIVDNHEEYNIVSVNMSLSDGVNHTTPASLAIIEDELIQLVQNNVTVVSAAGNTGKIGVSLPAASPNSLAVSSVNNLKDGVISSFSQHHPDLTNVFADGKSITSANRKGGTKTLSGTSMATPYVSGAIAVAQQLAEQELGRRLTFEEIKDLLAQGDDISAPSQYVEDYRGKVINIEKLGNAILEMVPSETLEPPTIEESVIAQIGQITDLNHNNKTVFLAHEFVNPIVFAQPPSFKGPQASTVRITNIQGDRFSAQIQEPGNLDGLHAKESLSFLVLEEGIWELSDGTIIEVGVVNTNATTSSDWQDITFNYKFTAAPVVLTQVQTNNDTNFVRTRQDNITKNGFEVALEEEEAYRNSGHGTETIAWLAISGGQGTWDGNAFIAGNTGDKVTHNWHTIDFGVAFDNKPKFLGNIATFDGPDPSGLRYRNLSNGNVQIKIEEDTSRDSETNHTTENINFLAVEATGTLNGFAVDSLTGVTNAQTEAINGDVFTLGNAIEPFYNHYGQQDYLEIIDFDMSRDTIELHGGMSDYYLRTSPFSTNDQGIFLKFPGMEDELIGIVKNTNNLDLNSNNFVFT